MPAETKQKMIINHDDLHFKTDDKENIKKETNKTKLKTNHLTSSPSIVSSWGIFS